MKIRAKYSETAALLIVTFMSLAANLPDYFLGGIVSREVLLIALTASVVIVLFLHLRFLLFIAIATLAIGANLPGELASILGLAPSVLMIALGVLIAVALLNYVLMLLPTGSKEPKMDTIFSRKAVLKAVAESDQVRLLRLVKLVELNFVQDGATPVFLAAEKGNADIMRILITHGANTKLRNKEGKTPMEAALAHGFARVAEIIHYADEVTPVRPGWAAIAVASSKADVREDCNFVSTLPPQAGFTGLAGLTEKP